MKSLLITTLLVFFSFSSFAADPPTERTLLKCKILKCRGYDGPGGPCYNGPGGALYDGPGGACYDGPGGNLYDGPGGALYDGPGGACYDGPGGNCYDGPGGTGEKCSPLCEKK